MSYTLEKLPDEPIVISVLNADHTITAEGEQGLLDISKLLDAQDKPVYLILDVSSVTFGLDDLMQGTSMATRQYQLFKHPKLIETLAVTNSRFVQLVAKGLNSTVFGNVNVRAFESRSGALVYIRSQTAKQNR